MLILGAGIYQLLHPPATLLAELHAAVWWGAFLTIIGVAYVYFFMPRKS